MDNQDNDAEIQSHLMGKLLALFPNKPVGRLREVIQLCDPGTHWSINSTKYDDWLQACAEYFITADEGACANSSDYRRAESTTRVSDEVPESMVEQVLLMFPDADEGWIRSTLIYSSKRYKDNIVDRTCNYMFENPDKYSRKNSTFMTTQCSLGQSVSSVSKPEQSALKSPVNSTNVLRIDSDLLELDSSSDEDLPIYLTLSSKRSTSGVARTTSSNLSQKLSESPAAQKSVSLPPDQHKTEIPPASSTFPVASTSTGSHTGLGKHQQPSDQPLASSSGLSTNMPLKMSSAKVPVNSESSVQCPQLSSHELNSKRIRKRLSNDQMEKEEKTRNHVKDLKIRRQMQLKALQNKLRHSPCKGNTTASASISMKRPLRPEDIDWKSVVPPKRASPFKRRTLSQPILPSSKLSGSEINRESDCHLYFNDTCKSYLSRPQSSGVLSTSTKDSKRIKASTSSSAVDQVRGNRRQEHLPSLSRSHSMPSTSLQSGITNTPTSSCHNINDYVGELSKNQAPSTGPSKAGIVCQKTSFKGKKNLVKRLQKAVKAPTGQSHTCRKHATAECKRPVQLLQQETTKPDLRQSRLDLSYGTATCAKVGTDTTQSKGSKKKSDKVTNPPVSNTAQTECRLVKLLTSIKKHQVEPRNSGIHQSDVSPNSSGIVNTSHAGRCSTGATTATKRSGTMTNTMNRSSSSPSMSSSTPSVSSSTPSMSSSRKRTLTGSSPNLVSLSTLVRASSNPSSLSTPTRSSSSLASLSTPAISSSNPSSLSTPTRSSSSLASLSTPAISSSSSANWLTPARSLSSSASFSKQPGALSSSATLSTPSSSNPRAMPPKAGSPTCINTTQVSVESVNVLRNTPSSAGSSSGFRKTQPIRSLTGLVTTPKPVGSSTRSTAKRTPVIIRNFSAAAVISSSVVQATTPSAFDSSLKTTRTSHRPLPSVTNTLTPSAPSTNASMSESSEKNSSQLNTRPVVLWSKSACTRSSQSSPVSQCRPDTRSPDSSGDNHCILTSHPRSPDSTNKSVVVIKLDATSSGTYDLTCEACFVGLESEKTHQCCDGHIICTQCVEKQAKAVLSNSAGGTVLCPCMQCLAGIPRDNLMKALPSIIMDLLDERLQQEALKSLAGQEQFVLCPSCAFGAFLDLAWKQFKCRNCSIVTCRHCKATWDTGTHKDCGKEVKEEGNEAVEMVEDEAAEDISVLPAQPSHWTGSNVNGKIFVQELVQPSSQEWASVRSLFSKTLGEAQIKYIHRIQNFRLWRKYCVTRQNMLEDIGEKELNEKLLFHGTRVEVIDGICRDGFDWRMCGRNGIVYGQGAYFARDAHYSHKYVLQSHGMVRGSQQAHRALVIQNLRLLTASSVTVSSPVQSAASLSTVFYPNPNCPHASYMACDKYCVHGPVRSRTSKHMLARVQRHSAYQQPGYSATQSSGQASTAITSLPLPSPTAVAGSSGIQSASQVIGSLQPHSSICSTTSAASSSQPSTSSAEAPADNTQYKMFLAKVLVGRPTLGKPDYRKPPRDPKFDDGRAFDSCVNKTENPQVFVIFDSSQAYPEYLITYTLL